MSKGYFPLFFDTLEETLDLNDEEFGRLIRASLMYAMGDAEYQDYITGNERYAFRFIKGQIDRNIEIKNIRAKAGSSRKEQNETNENKDDQSEAKQLKEKEKEKKKEQEELFERFWAVYPRHVNKPAAKKAFLALKPDEELLKTMMDAVDRQKKSPQWQDQQYIPHPATWLHGNRWEDDVQMNKSKAGAVTAQNYSQRDYEGEQEEAMRRMLEELNK